MPERGRRRRETGIVVSAKSNKTITVDLRKLVRHPQFGKYVYRTTRCYVHDEKNEAREGDKVEIMETRPLSKQKRWRLVKVLERKSEQ